MKALKRILACITIAALVFSTIPPSYIKAQANEVYSGRLWLAGAIPGHECTATCLHLQGNDGFLSSIGEATIGLSSVDDDSGVWLNETDKNSLWLIKYNGTNDSYMVGGLGDIDVAVNTKVTIKGNFKCSDQATYGDGTVTFEETTFIFDGTTWRESAVANESTAVTLTSGTKDGINVQATTGFQKDDTWMMKAYAVRDGVSGVYVDGQWKDIALILLKYSDGAENHYFDLTYSAGGAAATAGTKVLIRGKFVQGNHVVEFEPTVFVFDGTTWSVESFMVTGIYQYRITADPAWQIWMTPEGTFAGEAGEAFSWPATINDEDVDGGIQIFKDGGMFCAQIWSSQIPCDGSANATVVLQKGVETGNQGNVAYLEEDVTLCFNKHGVSLDEPIGIQLAEGTTVIEPETVTDGEGEDCQYVTFESLRDYQTFDDGNGWDAWDIWLKPSETLQGGIDEAYQGLQMTVKSGTQTATFSVDFYHAEAFEGSAWLRLDHNLLPLDITEATEIIIHAGSATSVETGKKMQLTQDCILQIDTSEKWKKPIYDSKTWEIHLELSGLFSGVEDETFIWPAVIENEDADKKETIVEITKENGQYVFRPTALEFPADGTEGTLSLQSGTVTGSEGSVVKLPLETKLYVNRYGLQKDEPIIPDTEKVGMTIMPGSTNKTQLYLHAMQTDAFPVDNTWNIRPVSADGFVEGAYYFGANNGLFIADVNVKPNAGSPLVEFIKTDVFYNAGLPETEGYNEYFIGLSSIESTITDGTTITLKGLFMYNGQLVEYLPTSFQWDSETSTWNVAVDTTYISGDANGDEKADAKDIVRLKRYEAQTDEDAYVIPISMVDADLIMEEDSYKVDAVDLQELRLQLIDAAEIELAAYCGPRREGYRYYMDNDNDDGSDGNFDGNVNVEYEYGTHPEDPEGGWEGWITEKDFQDYVNCGFTYLLPEQDANYDFSYADGATPTDNFYESDLYPYMELAEKMNIPVLAHANSLTSMTMDIDGVLTEDNKAFLDTLYSDLSKYKMFKGYAFADEPTYQSAASFLLTKNYLADIDIKKSIYTACLPITASKESLAADNSLSQEVAYDSYMDSFYGATGSFVYDLYPLITNTNTGNRVDSEWFSNLRLVAEHAKNNQYDAGIVVQSTSYGFAKSFEMKDNPEYHRTIETKADVGFQVYTALAYGMRAINYYSYWTHWSESARGIDSSAMVNYPTEAGGEPIKTNAYYAVKAVNQEIKKFDHVFLSFNWQGTMALAPEGATMSDALSGVLDNSSNYQSENMTATATEETIIGCMKDENGQDGFMIVNATEPSAGKTSKVTIKIADATKAYAYIKGSKTEIILQNGVYELEVGAGEGVFVIPFS